jgi:hypothetical protein
MKRAALALTVVAAVAAAPAQADTQRHFRTPSKRIACLMLETSVRCDTFFLNDVAFRLTANGAGKRIHVTDTVALVKEPILAYGKSAKVGPFTCSSHEDGLTCTNRKGHGFFVSRQRQRVF